MPHPYGNAALEQVAKDTLAILAAGGFDAPSGARIDLAVSMKSAIVGTRSFEPAELDVLLDGPAGGVVTATGCRVEVTLETTQEAASRLFFDENVHDPAVLNFASATRPGGGFLHGSKAQEEDLARCSALYPCLQAQTEFYAFHRMVNSDLYSDRMIYSPRVPFFRVHGQDVPERVYEASVITAAAPNAGTLLKAGASSRAAIEAVFRRRTGKILALAEAQKHRVLVLGAWGCGVFANDPVMAADAFGAWLESARFRERFDRVLFAVYDPRPEKPSYMPFVTRFSMARYR